MSNAFVLDKISNSGLPVIIFGAGTVGEALFYACGEEGINVETFCDNNISKAGLRLCDVEILLASKLKTRYKDAIFLIAAADIKDVVEQLNALGYSKWHPSGLLLRDFDLSRYQFNASTEFVEFTVSTCLLCHDGYLNPDKLFLRSVDLIITERCSLKCRDCSNLMQYYDDPKDCDINDLIRSIDAFCAVIDGLNEFRVIGGEPFMNKEINLVIKRLIDEPKVRKIVIYTNGTIIPRNHLECLKNDKVLFIITDYGALSRKLNELVLWLRENNIAYHILEVQGWSDCAEIKDHQRNDEQKREIFTACCAKNLITLSDGKLFRCPFVANAFRLRAVPDYKDDYINIIQGFRCDADIRGMKKSIKSFLLEKEFLETCNYCKGRALEAPADLMPAIQIKKPLKYERLRKQSNN